MSFLIRVVFLLLIMIPAVSYSAESVTENREIKTISIDTKKVEGKLKAGVVLGYPWGITAGYRFSNFFEMNGVLGSDYNYLTTGINGLFTIVNVKISHEIFPLSVGPALYSHFGHHDRNNKFDRDDEYISIDLLGIARIEYNFKEIPLNLFIEAGIGMQVVRFADTAGSFAIGARYIF